MAIRKSPQRTKLPRKAALADRKKVTSVDSCQYPYERTKRAKINYHIDKDTANDKVEKSPVSKWRARHEKTAIEIWMMNSTRRAYGLDSALYWKVGPFSRRCRPNLRLATEKNHLGRHFSSPLPPPSWSPATYSTAHPRSSPLSSSFSFSFSFFFFVYYLLFLLPLPLPARDIKPASSISTRRPN